MGQPYYNQQSFRWRDDDGSETGATWLAVANAALPNPAADTTYRLRVLVQNTGDKADTPTLNLYYSYNSGTYTQVTTTSSYVRMTASGTVSDTTATTQQLGSGSWVAGEFDSNGSVSSTSLTNGYETEMEFCFQFRSADLSSGDTIDLQVYNSSSALNNYTNTPSVSFTGEWKQTAYRIRSGDTIALNTDSGWAAAMNTSASIGRGAHFRIRFKLAETKGFGSSQNLHVQVRRNSGTWVDCAVQTRKTEMLAGLPTTITPAIIVDSDQYADGDATSTELLTTSARTYINGVGDEATTGATQGGNVFATTVTNQDTEIEICFQIMSTHDTPSAAENVATDTLEFRLVRGTVGSTTVLDAYDNTPSVTVTDTNGYIGGTSPETGFTWFGADTDGVLYCLAELCESTNTLMIFKSSDGGDTWRVQDMSNAPTQGDMESADIKLENDRIYILQIDGGDDCNHHVFRVSTHSTNPDTWETIDDVVESGQTSANPQQCAIARRSDGDLLAIYAKDNGSDLHLYYRLDEGSGWGSALALDTTSGYDARGVVAVRGASDKIHIVYGMCDTSTDHTIWHRSLDSSNTLSSRESVRAITTASDKIHVTPIYYFDDGGNEVISILVFDDVTDDLYLYKVTNDGSPSLVASEFNDNQVSRDEGSGSYCVNARLGLSGTDHHVIYAHETDLDLYHDESTNKGVTWGTDTEVWDGIDLAFLEGNTFTHSSGNGGETVFGMVIDEQRDGGTGQIRYSETIITTTSYVNFTVSGAAVSSTAAADLNVTRTVTVTGAAASATNDVDLNVTREVTIQGAASSSITDINLALIKFFTILANAVSSTTDVDLAVTRTFTATGAAASDVTDVELAVARLFTLTGAAASNITDIDLLVVKLFTILANAVSSITDVDLDVTRAFTVTGDATSDISDVGLDVTRAFTILANAVSSISDIDLNVVKLFTILANAVSSIADVDLDVTREFTVQGDAVSSISDIILSVTGIIEFIVSANATSSLTDVDLDVTRLFTVQGDASSSISDIILSVAGIIEFIVQGSATSSLTDLDLDVTRLFQVAGNAASSTADIELAVTRLFTIAGAAASSITDLDLALIKEFILSAGATSAIPDATLAVTRAFEVSGAAESQIADAVLAVERAFTIAAGAESNISDILLRDLAAAIVGLMIIALSGSAPRTGMSGSKPDTTMTGSAPDITLTGRA